jgi:NAD-dependent deacetylase
MNLKQFSSEISQVVAELKTAKSVFVITGAGMSADSGLPTYRGVGGLYENKDTEDGIPIEQALSGPTFCSNPEITWKYLGQIEESTRDASFNRGHEVLAEMEKHFDRFWILTQNIDGFHTAAGSENVIEIHGNMHRLQCLECEHEVSRENFEGLSIPPMCPRCDAMMRPLVVLFEEALPVDAIEILDREMRMSYDAVISIGTSSYFPYIVQPVVYAKQTGVFTVEINPADTNLSEIVDVKLPLAAAAVLEEIWTRLQAC